MIEEIETLPIYSDKILELVKVFQEKDEHDKKGLGQTDVSTNPFNSVGVRGKAYLSDIEESDNDDDESSYSTDEDVNGSLSPKMKSLDATFTSNTSDNKIMNKKTMNSKISSGNKNKKKTKEDYMKQMGAPPSLSVTIDVNHHEKVATALKLPSVMVPPADEEDENRYEYNSTNRRSPMNKLYELCRNLNAPLANKDCKNMVLVLTLQSGRFAAAIFHKGDCVKHTTSTRYTMRKGQGGAQSSNDNAKGKAKSMGSQLRRQGEIQLRNDVANAMREWKGLLSKCSFFFLSVSKTLQKGFWDDIEKIIGREDIENIHFNKKSPKVISIPLDVGRPSHEGCCAIYEILTTCYLQRIDMQILDQKEEALEKFQSLEDTNKVGKAKTSEKEKSSLPKDTVIKKNITELSQMHLSAEKADVKALQTLLSIESEVDLIDVRAGDDEMTPLHYAAAAKDASAASACVHLLLVEGHANPCITDARNRPPYFLASSELVRNSFRKARFEIGENVWNWDENAKVGPALSEDEMQRKKEKAAEKKKRQRLRQKERKAQEKAEEDAAKEAEDQRVKQKKAEEESKRIRDGLKPKKSSTKAGQYACDFCQNMCKRKSQMFARLEYYYCSTECVKKHQRELMASAAAARFAKS